MIATVKNWKQFQHYKDRSPPWVKLHKGLLDDYDYASLPLASKALAPLIWLLASESNDGSFEADPERLAFRIRWNAEDVRVGISGLIQKGFVLCDSAMLAECKRDARPETERETDTNKEKKKKEQPPQAAAFEIPDWIRQEVWQGFAEMRKKKRAPLTVRACAMVITELIKLRSAGHEPNAVLDQSTRNSWTDVYAIKDQSHANGSRPSKTSVVERIADQIAANRAARGSIIEGELADP